MDIGRLETYSQNTLSQNVEPAKKFDQVVARCTHSYRQINREFGLKGKSD